MRFFTGRNEVVAKVIFLHLSVIHSVHGGGVCLSACWDATTPNPGADPPPRTRPPQTRQNPLPLRPDPPWSRHPPDQADPPRADTTPPPRADPPRTRQAPPRADTNPPRSRHPPRTRLPPEQTPSRHLKISPFCRTISDLR